MKQVRFLHQLLIAMAVALALGSCSSEEISDMDPTNQNGKHTMQMKFVGEVVGFDQQNSSAAKVQTRATTSSSWNDGDKIYITFYNGTTVVPGEATYSSASGWSVSYDGTLATGNNLKCEARYFVNATFQNSSLVTLNANTEIYEDLSATYTYSDGSLTVVATLAPKTGRIRFTGISGQKIHLTGITTYTTFAPDINAYSTSEAMIHQSVASNGSTPYIYGYISTSERNISVVGSDFAFNRTLTSEILKTGESGYMAIPSETSHNNWRSGLYVKVSGIEMKMIPVAGLSSGFFLIGETEVTEALYNTVNGTTSSSQLPISNVSMSSINTFIEKLNYSTKLNFALPSTTQWKYAATGGNRSQGYNYAGSNTPGDVAWYKGNTTTRQNVKMKTPNELGIYDMSGNVAEYTSTKNSSFSSYYDYYGGSYIDSESQCQLTTANGFENNSSSKIGFRLILTCE